jgi:hypothetical protein
LGRSAQQKAKAFRAKRNCPEGSTTFKDPTGSLAVFYVEQVTVNRHVLYFNNPGKTLNPGAPGDQYNYANYRLNVINDHLDSPPRTGYDFSNSRWCPKPQSPLLALDKARRLSVTFRIGFDY